MIMWTCWTLTGCPTRLLCPWGFSRQEYWNGLLGPPPGELTNLGIISSSPTLQADSLPDELPGKPNLKRVIWEGFSDKTVFE